MVGVVQPDKDLIKSPRKQQFHNGSIIERFLGRSFKVLAFLGDLDELGPYGKDVVLTPNAKKQAKQLTEQGFGQYPICMAKTQYSFSDDPKLLGAPENFTVTVRNIKVSAGAGFLVALTGDILTMPGLPKVPAAEKIDVDEHGKISGLF